MNNDRLTLSQALIRLEFLEKNMELGAQAIDAVGMPRAAAALRRAATLDLWDGNPILNGTNPKGDAALLAAVTASPADRESPEYGRAGATYIGNEISNREVSNDGY